MEEIMKAVQEIMIAFKPKIKATHILGVVLLGIFIFIMSSVSAAASYIPKVGEVLYLIMVFTCMITALVFVYYFFGRS